MTIRETVVWRELSRRVLVPLAMAAHRSVLNHERVRASRGLSPSSGAGAGLRADGFEPVHSAALVELASRLREELSGGPVATTRARMAALPDGKAARRGIVDLELSEETLAEVLRVVTAPSILEPVVSYFGFVPTLQHVGVTLTCAGRSQALGSELWHRDQGGISNATLFVYLSDVDEGSGPFHYVGTRDLPRAGAIPFEQGRATAEQDWDGWERMRLSDQRFSQYVPASAVHAVTGPPGTAFLVDQHAAYHKGGFCQSGDRLVLQALFSTAGIDGETPVTDLIGRLSPTDRAEMLADQTLGLVFSPSQTRLQRWRAPMKLRRFTNRRLTYIRPKLA